MTTTALTHVTVKKENKPLNFSHTASLESVRRGSGRQTGFSLIELIAVVAILGILAAVVAPKIFTQPGKARIAKAKTDISNIETALKMYQMENFNFPTTDQGLLALVEQPTGDPEAPNWQEGGYLDKLPKDPWGREYMLVSPGEKYDVDIYTLGRDGQSGGEGEDADIFNSDL